MKALLITGDIAALGGIIVGWVHILPAIEAAVATGLGGLYYGVLLWDRFRKKGNGGSTQGEV